jgi:hypothetical protein
VLAMLDDARDEDLVIVMNGHGLEAIPVVHA